MHYILHVRVPGFYSIHLCEKDSSLSLRALVVHRDKAVLDANEGALRLGIHVGMALTEAKTLAREAQFVAWKEEDYRSAQEAWLGLCALHTCVIEPAEQHEAFLDLSGHGDPFEVSQRIAAELRERFGCAPRLGLARTKWLARVASDACGDVVSYLAWEMAMRECLEHPERFLAPMPLEALLPVEQEDRRRLSFLGYRTVGEVAELSLDLLKSQFGQRALTIYQASRGAVVQAVRPEYPKDSLRAAIRFEGGAESWEQVEAGLKSLARRIGGALKARDAQGTALGLEIEHEDGRVETKRRKFLKPIANARGVFVALKLLLGEARTGAITTLKARLDGLEKTSRAQTELSGVYALQARKETAENALKSVRTVFGDGSVQIAAELPQPRRVRLLRAWCEATGWR